MLLHRLLLLILCLLAAAPAFAGDRYISPSGKNAGTCETSGSPCLTFAYVLPLLDPGETLWVNNGTYTPSTTGLPDVYCGSGSIVDGTSNTVRIKIQAVNERQALLYQDQDGLYRETIQMANCEYWSIIGLSIRNHNDAPVVAAGYGGLAWINNSSNIDFKRNLLYRVNQGDGAVAVSWTNSHNSLLEENELYYFDRHGISISQGSSNNIIRRNYANPRDFQNDDPCFIIYPGSTNIFENNICENGGTGYQIEAPGGTTDNLFLGNMAIGWIGTSVRGRDQAPINTIFRNHVTIGRPHFIDSSLNNGINARDTTDTQFFNSSIFGHATGFTCDPVNNATPPVAQGEPSCFATNTLSMGNTGYGFQQTGQLDWFFNFTASSGNGTAYDPVASHANITNEFTTTPTGMGPSGCYLWVPSTSNLFTAGSGGGPIGATVLYKYANAVLTTEILWNATTGVFLGCGATLAGVNDVAGDSCNDVHDDLNVDSVGCPFPSGYGGAGSPTLTMTWPYPAQQVFQRPNGATMSIEWSSTDITGNVDLDYSTDNGATWNFIASAAYNSSPYSFNANTAKVPATTAFLIRVSQGPTQDISDAVATVRGRWVK